jgi:hypothetical protein
MKQLLARSFFRGYFGWKLEENTHEKRRDVARALHNLQPHYFTSDP